jgi:carbamate kinase
LPLITTAEAREYLRQGQFPPGSMGPKIEAAMQFVENRGKRAVICSIADIEAAVRGKAGTQIVK